MIKMMRCIRMLPIMVLAFVVGGASPQNLHREGAVPSSYFGMHIHRATTTTPWPAIPFGNWRLWDAGVAWPQLEPNKGDWHFETLDKYVQLAQQHHVEILLTLGLTPQWASTRPQEASDYKPGNAAEPKDMRDWQDYVRAVATRYKGKIRDYEIWNEPNRKQDFSGDVHTMVELTRQASEIIKQVDPSNTVVSASATAVGGIPWFNQYLAQGAGKYVDVIGYHFYVTPEPPEKAVPLIQSVQQAMAANGISSKPLWDTETGWANPTVFTSPDQKAAYVARAYIIDWAAGVSRFYWYAWDNHGWVTLEMTNRDTEQPALPAFAYATTESWLVGAVMKSCDSTGGGTWVCELSKGNSPSWIVWNADGDVQFQIPARWQAHSVTDLSGNEKKLHGGVIPVGISPQLLR